MIGRIASALKWWLSTKIDAFMRVDLPYQWADVQTSGQGALGPDEPDVMGECDTCDAPYEVWDRDGRCGDCGECSDHCEHKCEKCGEPLYPENVGCVECRGHIISVSYQGFAGSFYDQPEPAEGIMWCPICQDETDSSFDFTNAWCVKHDGEVEIDEPGDDDDDAYERARDAAEMRRSMGS